MVAPENLDLVVQVRILAGQYFDERFKDNYFSGRPGNEDEIRDPERIASRMR